MKGRTRILLWLGFTALLLIAVGAWLWVRTFRHYTPKEVLADVRAGLAALHIREPQARVEAFLEARYGSLANPTNRQRAFLDFYSPDHIKGLAFIVKHTPPEQKQANTQAMAQWIAGYRETMSPEERAALRAQLDTEAGRAMLRQATAVYQSQDVYFSGAQAPVIGEIMKTLTAVQQE